METIVTLNGRHIAEMPGIPEQAEQKINSMLRRVLDGSLLVGVALALHIRPPVNHTRR